MKKGFIFVNRLDSIKTSEAVTMDSLELIRFIVGRVLGKLSDFLMTVKSLPFSYNKDFKAKLFFKYIRFILKY